MYARLTAEEVAKRVEGPLLFLRRTLDVGYNEAVAVEGSDGVVRLGRIATVDEDTIVVEVLDDTAGLGLTGTRVRFFGEAAAAPGGPRHSGSRVQRCGKGDRRRAAHRGGTQSGHRWAAHQAGGAGGAAGFPADRHYCHRSHEQPGARAETAAVLRWRPAA